jgi:hypothetical protein
MQYFIGIKTWALISNHLYIKKKKLHIEQKMKSISPQECFETQIFGLTSVLEKSKTHKPHISTELGTIK